MVNGYAGRGKNIDYHFIKVGQMGKEADTLANAAAEMYCFLKKEGLL